MTVTYEWDVEEVSTADTLTLDEGDIVEHWFRDSFADCLKLTDNQKPQDGCAWRIVLVRDTDSTFVDDPRSWAYLGDDGALPERFSDSGGNDATKVPKRFHEEVARAKKERT